MLTLKKVKSAFKKYWQYIIAFFGGLLALVFFRKNVFTDDLKESREEKDKLLNEIDNLRKGEREEQDQALKKLDDNLKNIQNQYDKEKKELDEKKKQEIKEILKTYENDPVGLAQKLSEATGFKIIIPDD